MKYGTVAIVGRPNVGKSSLFNRLAGDKLAITDDQSGITRDRLYSKCVWLDQEFSIIDTGGIELNNTAFMDEIRAQAQLAIDEADVIVFVCDGRCGVTKEDSDVINILHKSNKPIIVAANKIDDVKFMENVYEFYNLGVEEVIAVSCIHGIGIGDLLDKIVELLPIASSKPKKDSIDFCIIGQPNVGKSSLTNAILGTERVIVSPIAGTTRDAIDTSFIKDGKTYTVIDTAGIRKSGKIYENAEKYSVLRAMRAIERSNVVLFLIDATRGIDDQDRHVAGYAIESKKALIIVVNKWDAVKKDDKSMQEWIDKIRNTFVYLDYAPIVFVSALKNQRVHTIFEEIDKVYENYTRRVQTNVLNDVLLDATLLQVAPQFNGDRLRIYYASQVETSPPTFVLFVNDPKYLHFSYQRYLENQLRQAFEFEGSPIKLILRKKRIK